MKYFVFDMDETLAELYSVYYFVASLRIKEILKEDNKADLPSHLDTTLARAYRKFVSDIVREESSSHPLGILRPGILDVMKHLYDLQRASKINNVIIYSNNGHLQSLEFIRDLIHNYLGTHDLIKECIHWNHHMRAEERTLTPGAANKTWNVLKNIMVSGNCGAHQDLQPTDIYFFDDLDHKDLKAKLGPNYFQVPGYDFKASFDRISDIYLNALTFGHVDTKIFVKYILDTFTDIKNGQNKYMMADVIDMFKLRTKGTVREDVYPPRPDDAIDMMMEAVKRSGQIAGFKRRRLFVITTKRVKRRRFRRKNTKRSTRKKN